MSNQENVTSISTRRAMQMQVQSEQFDEVGDIWVTLFKMRERMKQRGLYNVLAFFDAALEELTLELVTIARNKRS